MIKKNNQTIEKIYKGTIEIAKIYKGSTLVYENYRKLPEGYTELEYIEASGTQFITTNVKIASNNIKIETEVMKTTDSSNEFDIIGNQDNYSGRFILGAYENSYWFLYSRNPNSTDPEIDNRNYSINVKYKLIATFENNKKTLTSNNNYLEANFGNNIISNNYLQVFANGFSNYKFVGRIYYLKLYEDGKTILNLIPAERISDNVLGMYDTVSESFLTNQGTGTFTAGPK